MIINIALAVAVRTSHVKYLQDKYLVGFDAYLFYHQAKIIVKEGKLPERDNMRYVPIGIQSNQRANLNSYAIAYFYKVARLFMPKITLEQAAIAYPVVCFALALIAFTLLVSKLFSRAMALLSVTILATVPALVFKTMAGFADRDALELLEMFLIFYFYVWANQTRNVRNQLLLSAISGIITGILALTWPGAGIVMAIIVLYNLVKLLMGEYGKRELYLYISWYLPTTFMSVVLTRAYTDVSQPDAIFVAFAPTGAFWGIAVATVAICGRYELKRKLSLSNRIPVGLAVSIIALLLFAILIGLASGPTAVVRSIHKVGESFLYPIFGDTPLAKEVNELKRMNIFGWWDKYKGFLFVFMVGAIMSVWKLAREYHLSWKILTSSFTVMLAMTVISSMSVKPPLDGYTTLSNTLYVIPILIFFGLAYTLYLRKYQYRDIQEKPFDNLIFTLVWFTILFFCTRAARRFDILFAPAAVILGSYAVIEFLKILGKGNVRLTEKLVVYMVMTILCWEAFAFGNILSFTLSALSFENIKASLGTRIDLNITCVIIILLVWLGMKLFLDGKRAGYIKSALFFSSICIMAVILGGEPLLASGYVRVRQPVTIPSEEWVKVIDWMKKNTEEDAVFALCWNHGNRILALAERATIADNEQIPYQVHLQARHLFLAQSEKEALEFLFTHKVTHLLISSADIDIIDTISRIGANEQFDRQTSIHYLRRDKSGLHFSPELNSNLPIKSVDLELNLDGNLTSAIITVNDEQIKLQPKLTSAAGQKHVFSDDNLKGCVVVTPMEVGGCGCGESEKESKKSWNAIYLLEKQQTTLKEEEDSKPADLSLVFVLARSDLTLGFTPLLKDYLSKYVAKIEAQGQSIACGMVVYSPANLYGAGIYRVSSDKERLRFLLSELDKIRGDEYDAFKPREAWRGDSRALDGLAVALEKNFFQSEAQRRLLFITRNKVGDISDLQSSGFLRKYCPMSSLDEVIKRLRKAKIRVDVVGLKEQRAHRLAKETGGRFSDVLLLEAGELKP